MLKEYIINEFGINPKVADICFDAEKKVEKYFKKIDFQKLILTVQQDMVITILGAIL